MTFNCCSIRNKIHEVMELAESENVDVLCVQETWLRDCDTPLVTEIKEYGYRIVTERKTRENDIGGGIAFILKNNLKMKRIFYKQPKSFESLSVQLESGNCKYIFTNIGT